MHYLRRHGGGLALPGCPSPRALVYRILHESSFLQNSGVKAPSPPRRDGRNLAWTTQLRFYLRPRLNHRKRTLRYHQIQLAMHLNSLGVRMMNSLPLCALATKVLLGVESRYNLRCNLYSAGHAGVKQHNGMP